jgi:tetratricopeptide (TPR) repeat protein
LSADGAFEASNCPCYTKSTMSDEIARQQALIVMQRANRHLAKGEIADARLAFERSLALWPTPEAYVGLGQTYGMTNRHDEAIEWCQKAIEVDPAFGQAYNDIGVYLIESHRWEEAIAWLEKALRANRYDSPGQPLYNLGRVYIHLGQYRTALRYLDQSIAIDPFDRPAIWAKFSLLARSN